MHGLTCDGGGFEGSLAQQCSWVGCLMQQRLAALALIQGAARLLLSMCVVLLPLFMIVLAGSTKCVVWWW
jgi:hypothetical protein